MCDTGATLGSAANTYEILTKLAAGGMAELFLARSTSLGGIERFVVLKRVLPELAADETFARMFLDEARLVAQLQHPHVAQVYDIGRMGDSYFFTMEYVHGKNLHDLLYRANSLRRTVPLGDVLTVIAQTAAALHHAHERSGADGRSLGIVHRDVTPSNILTSYEGHVKLVDFGVARAADREHKTQAGTVKGKISYLSPEQCRAIPSGIDRRSDLFSLGIVMWELLTAERLFYKGSDLEIMKAIVGDEPPLPGALRKDTPLEVDAIVKKLLAKDPERRFQTAAEVVTAVEDFAGRNGHVLSASSVARQLRELFGPPPPEPWIAAVKKPPIEIVTVAGVPLPGFAPPAMPIAPSAGRPVMRLDDPPIRPPTEPPPMIVEEPKLSIWLPITGALATAVIAASVMYVIMKRAPAAAPPIDARPIDAAIVVDAIPVDAIPIDAEIDAPLPIDASLDPIFQAFADERFVDVVELCLAAPTIDDHGATCTMAACRANYPTEAKRWARFVSIARRNLVLSTCAKAGIGETVLGWR